MRRLTAIALALAIVVGGSLAGATPASAADLSYGCITGAPSGEISCTVVIPNGRNILMIEWSINGISEGPSGSAASIRFPCTPGQRYTVSYVAFLSPPTVGGERFQGSVNLLCRGAAISNVSAGCSSGGSRLQCSVTYTGGTPWVSIRWTVNGVVRTFFNDQWWLDISCNAPSQMSVSVTVSDAFSARTASGVCSCHSGPLD